MKCAHLLSACLQFPAFPFLPRLHWSCIFFSVRWLDVLFMSLGHRLLVMIMLQVFQRVLLFSSSVAYGSLSMDGSLSLCRGRMSREAFILYTTGIKYFNSSPLNVSQLCARQMIFCSEGKYSWGYPWTTNIFCSLATWMVQVLQGNSHQSLCNSFGLSLGGRH